MSSAIAPRSTATDFRPRLATGLTDGTPFMKATETELFDVIAKEAIIDREKLVREATLADLGISSLDVISMLFEVEEKYGVIIEEGDLPPMTTLGEMVDYLLSRINTEAVA